MRAANRGLFFFVVAGVCLPLAGRAERAPLMDLIVPQTVMLKDAKHPSIAIVNDGLDTIRVELSAQILEASPGATLTVKPKIVVVPPAGRKTATLVAGGSAGQLRAQIVAVERTRRVVLRRDVLLAPPPAMASRATVIAFAAPEGGLKIDARQTLGFRPHNTLLPLASSWGITLPEIDALVTKRLPHEVQATSADGRSAAVVLGNAKETSVIPGAPPRRLAAVNASLQAFPHHGIFEAVLRPFGDDKAPGVKLQITTAHPLWCPILMVVAGIGLALLTQYVLTVATPASRLRRRVQAAVDAYAEHAEKDWSCGQYDLGKDLKRQSERIGATLDERLSRSFTSLEDVQPIADAVSKLEASVDAWRDFHRELGDLDHSLTHARKGITGAPRPYGIWPSPEEPHLFVEADKLRTGHAIGADELSRIREKVRAATAELPRWQVLNATSALQYRLVQSLAAHAVTQLSTDEKTRLDATSARLQRVWVALWITTELNAAIPGLPDLEAELRAIQLELSILSGHLAPKPGAPAIKAEPILPVLLPSPTAVAAAPARARRSSGFPLHPFRRIMIWSIVVAIIVGAVAAYAILSSSYFGKPWGAPKDYFDALSAGFGSQALASIATAMGSMLGERAARRSSKATTIVSS